MSTGAPDPDRPGQPVGPRERDRYSGPVELPLADLITILVRRAGLLALVAGVTFATVVGVTLVRPRLFTSTASFMPQTRSSQSNLSGLAAQFGLALPTGDATRSPAFYSDLLRTRQLLGRVVDAGYPESSLVDLTTKVGPSAALRRDQAINRLRKRMAVTLVQRTGVIRVGVQATGAERARQIADRVLEELNRLNLEVRRSQATAERQFTERRLAEVKQELLEAENRLQTFLQRNREYGSSPQLRFDQDRLARDVMLRQQVYTTLAQAYEQAKIEEIRDTPLISIVEAPEVPVKPDPRGLIRKGLLALFGGVLLGGAWVLGRPYIGRQAASRP